MRAAIGAGASMINDIKALLAPGALEAVAASDAAVCLMHMRGEPATMQDDPRYDDVVGEVGQGFVLAMQTLELGRIGMCHFAIGIADAAYEAS